jgi:hypothetical protein
MSRTFLYGSTKGTPFHFSTMTLLDEPMPMANRPGAASASDATHCANAAGERVKAGTIADSARATQIQEQVMQDWKIRHKMSKKWGKIMQGRSRVRIRALKRETYNKPTVWVGSKVTKKAEPMRKKAPLHMLWRTHVVGDDMRQSGKSVHQVGTQDARTQYGSI